MLLVSVEGKVLLTRLIFGEDHHLQQDEAKTGKEGKKSSRTWLESSIRSQSQSMLCWTIQEEDLQVCWLVYLRSNILLVRKRDEMLGAANLGHTKQTDA